ncbi:retrovirus-related pol polyprotein from transposon TNT 1-94 [Tanacetum coccineum]
MKDNVVQNNSQVKFKKIEVEDHNRISSISNKTKSVTACIDSLKSRTLNVNVVCATCEKCVFNSNHDACVSKFINDVNARTKKPKVVPISTRKPKSQANKSVATAHKKTDPICQIFHHPLIILKIVQLILFIVDSGCTKHMMGNLKLLCNFIEKYLGTVHFGNDQFAPILGYGDFVQGNIMIKRVYYIEFLNYNLFSVGQFYDADLEVAFCKSTCFIRDLQGNDLLTSNRGYDLYTISLRETSSPTPICFLAKASPTQAWIKWCSSYELSKAKRITFKTNTSSTSKAQLNLLHMDLCGPMRIESINGKKYILTLHAYFKEEGIEHQTSTPRTPEQNGVVKRRNYTLVEAARTMLLASKLPLFFWAEATATAYLELSMFALTVSTAKPKNIKEAMADSAWIEAMQDELHQFDRLQVWELVNKPFSKKVIKLKWLWKNKKNEDQTVIRNKERLVAKGTSDPPIPMRYLYQPDQLDVKEAGLHCNVITKAEYVALSASCAQLMWMRTQLKDYGFDYNKVPLTEYQLANMLTKALPQDRFEYLIRRIGMRCLTPTELEVLANEFA